MGKTEAGGKGRSKSVWGKRKETGFCLILRSLASDEDRKKKCTWARESPKEPSIVASHGQQLVGSKGSGWGKARGRTAQSIGGEAFKG